MLMTEVLKPATEAELCEAIADAAASGRPLELIGTGSKRGFGRPMQTAATLDLSGFSGVQLYEPEELIVEAGAGTPLAEIEKAVAARGQQLAFEPPGGGTIGGTISCNLSGPRRIKAGAARDHVLGMRGVTGRGDIFKAGARVMKNVTGYDLPKLLTGSYGTLAALTSVTIKVLPKPETEETLAISGLDEMSAVRAMSLALQSPCEVSGAAHLPGAPPMTLLRLEGIAPSVAYRRDKLASLLKEFGAAGTLPEKQSKKQWRAIRDVSPLAARPGRCLWRISVAPSDGPRVTQKISASADARWFYDWGGGLVWLDVPSTDDAAEAVVRGAVVPGHATLIRAPDPVRAAVPVFQPQETALAALTRRVKQAFDPAQILNPGRMYRGV
ncbi:MAG: glycolate oxidase subunit GlcE [Hyphomicrobiales bacterium]